MSEGDLNIMYTNVPVQYNVLNLSCIGEASLNHGPGAKCSLLPVFSRLNFIGTKSSSFTAGAFAL